MEEHDNESGNHNREKFGHLKNQIHLPNVTSMWCLHKHLYDSDAQKQKDT